MMFEEGSKVWRRIDSNWYEARVEEKGEPETSGVVRKIVYEDDQKHEENVSVAELSNDPKLTLVRHLFLYLKSLVLSS